MQRLRRLDVDPRRFLLLTQVTLGIILVNIVTGAAVRLSDSGLGCPDWPDCTKRALTPPASIHPIVEFGNRMVVVLLVISCAATLVAALLRRPRRRDLTWLSGGLIMGVIGEALIGAVVVYSNLNAYVVMGHFMVGMALLGVSVLLVLRAKHAAGRGTLAVDRRTLQWSRVLVGMVVVVLAAGTAVTGSGPHAGGKDAKRVPIALEEMARIHSGLVFAAGAVLLIVLYRLWRKDAPRQVQDRGRILLGVMVVQGTIGYIQYFTHLPAVLVGFHVFGASLVWSSVLWFHHGISKHAPELAPVPDAPFVRAAETV